MRPLLIAVLFLLSACDLGGAEVTREEGAVVLYERGITSHQTESLGVSAFPLKREEVRVPWFLYEGGYLGEHPDGSATTGYTHVRRVATSFDLGASTLAREASLPESLMFRVWRPRDLYPMAQRVH